MNEILYSKYEILYPAGSCSERFIFERQWKESQLLCEVTKRLSKQVSF